MFKCRSLRAVFFLKASLTLSRGRANIGVRTAGRQANPSMLRGKHREDSLLQFPNRLAAKVISDSLCPKGNGEVKQTGVNPANVPIQCGNRGCFNGCDRTGGISSDSGRLLASLSHSERIPFHFCMIIPAVLYSVRARL